MGQAGKGRITNLTDLARAAGVSLSTASRALAGNREISVATRERVTALAKEHGYSPSRLGRNLRTGRTQAIGVVMPLGHAVDQLVSEPFFITMLGHLADALTVRGYDLLLSRVVPTDAQWLGRIAESGRVDGIVVIGQSNQFEAIEEMARRYLPLVVWGAHFEGQVHCSVGSDNRKGGEMATLHLLRQGRRRLAFFGNPDLLEMGERYRGFLDAHQALGLDAPQRILPVFPAAGIAHDAVAAFLDEQPDVDGVVAATDIIAISTIQALAEHGLRVPEDVAVIGYDDLSLARYASPPLTTIRQDIALGAGTLADLLLRRMAGEVTPSVLLQPALIVRRSVS
ncbi:LacI family transcriptional regulator [Sphingomonas oleivorans]|uniref:LacI family transcriptional regulator n=1 Tax=Sphingomonas oleivorans TaxID=1735121 RepID=A0A2T5G360_9SPHN|nr:LacI family DNA-binding transcriptional regulator [Sphingomonas oleivorans]PTQ13592.1 LacI family transcriptional regulator [Sphingomonas oleivorans]